VSLVFDTRGAAGADWPPSVHLIGVCGAGLRALAELLSDSGCRVSGSDLTLNPRTAAVLRTAGVDLRAGHSAENLPAACERVIHSAAVPPDNCERAAALARGTPVQSYPQFLGELTRRRDAVCIAGTHGKSTTTALVSALLSRDGRGPDVLCGAEVIGRARAGWAGDGRRLVVESCEFRRHFLQLTPHTLVVTGIEWDHVDCFGSLSDTVDAFAALMRRVREDGLLIYRGDCRASRRAVAAARMDRRCTGPRVVSCGSGVDCDWRFVSRCAAGGGSTVELRGPDEESVRLNVPLRGLHNAQNAALAAVAALESGLSAEQVTAGVAAFGGVRRRLEYLGEWRGMTLFDDYAHHPTALRAVLAALREEFPQRRLLAAFEPHQVQRTLTFRDDFADALCGADRSWVAPVYAARETAGGAIQNAAGCLVQAVAARGGKCELADSLDHLPAALETDGRPGDVVVLCGAGAMEQVADELSVRLRRNHAG
jgi:UDP-N-acetylmuramate--alanine ligase